MNELRVVALENAVRCAQHGVIPSNHIVTTAKEFYDFLIATNGGQKPMGRPLPEWTETAN